jgi:hypothetical protein
LTESQFRRFVVLDSFSGGVVRGQFEAVVYHIRNLSNARVSFSKADNGDGGKCYKKSDS